ncbi:hypothetical protein LguiA_033802 [Lonicera macranthoides]
MGDQGGPWPRLDFYCILEGRLPMHSVYKERDENSSSQKTNSLDKFEPKFDGLKFLETLVTAHK